MGPRRGYEGSLGAVVVGDLAFEAAVRAQIGPSVAGDLIAFVRAVPLEVDPGGREAAVNGCLEGPEGHLPSAPAVDLDEGGTAKIEMLLVPDERLYDPPFAGDPVGDAAMRE